MTVQPSARACGLRRAIIPCAVVMLAMALVGPLAADRTAQASSFAIDFENYALGPLGAPWFVSQAGSTTSTIVTAGKHGKVLRVNGGKGPDFTTNSLSIPATAGDLTIQFDVYPTTGAAFGFEVKPANSRYASDGIRLTGLPESGILRAANLLPHTDCATLPPNAWSRVSVVIHYAVRTYDVRLNGGPTSCSGLPFKLRTPGVPIDSIRVRDYSNEGYGGTVDWDNISGS